MNDVAILPHYADQKIQPIEFMAATMSPEAFKGFLRGNIIKYVSRAERKNGLEDYQKAQVYTNWLVEFSEKGVITVGKRQ